MNQEAFKYAIMNQFRDVNSPIRFLMTHQDMSTRDINSIYTSHRGFVVDKYRLRMHVERIIAGKTTNFQIVFEHLEELPMRRKGTELSLGQYCEDIEYREEVVKCSHGRIHFSLHAFMLEESEQHVFEQTEERYEYYVVFDIKKCEFVVFDAIKETLHALEEQRDLHGLGYVDYEHDEVRQKALVEYLDSLKIGVKLRKQIVDVFTRTRANGFYSPMVQIIQQLEVLSNTRKRLKGK